MLDFITFFSRNFWKSVKAAPKRARTSMAMKIAAAVSPLAVATPTRARMLNTT